MGTCDEEIASHVIDVVWMLGTDFVVLILFGDVGWKISNLWFAAHDILFTALLWKRVTRCFKPLGSGFEALFVNLENLSYESLEVILLSITLQSSISSVKNRTDRI